MYYLVLIDMTEYLMHFNLSVVVIQAATKHLAADLPE